MSKDEIKNVLSKINLIAVLDHSGRAGNTFFLTIFDQHPEVVTCPWIPYIYSYFITEFDSNDKLDSKRAHAFATQKTYFRYVYNDLNETHKNELFKIGADYNSFIDRDVVRKIFDEFVLSEPTISRKELISLIYISFAISISKDISKIKYILVSDAVSLRSEDVLHEFSGKVIDEMKKDFGNVKLISLVRDPRANFASSRHEFVNKFGNMYSIKFGNYFKQLFLLYQKKLRMDNGCVFLFWFCYFASTARVIYKLKELYKKNFFTVKNEDLNLNFCNTIEKLRLWLDITLISEWRNPDFQPTMVGKPWAGMGAYNSRYQKVMNGLLANDSPEIAAKVTGPNKYVTERWKTKLSKNEVYILEKLFYKEMLDMNYSFLYYNPQKEKNFNKILLKPFIGELPSLPWIIKGKNSGIGEVGNRFFYSISFFPFYFLARIFLFRLVNRKFFSNNNIKN